MHNFPTFFWKKFDEHKERVAFVAASPNGVETFTYWQWTRDVQKLAMGLIDAGFESGTRMAIVGSGDRVWFDLAFATWLAGGVVVPLVAGRDRRETLRCCARAGADWIAADSHTDLDAIRGQGAKLPEHLRWVSLTAARVGSGAADTVELPTLAERGRDLLKRGKLETLARRTYDLEADAPAMILFPVEPGDDPHGAFYSGAKLGVMLDALGADLQLEEDDRIAGLLSPGWLFASLLSCAALLRGTPLAVAETARELEAHFGDLQPTILACGPAWLEGQARQWQKRIEEAPALLKSVEAQKGPLRLGASAARSVLYDPLIRSLGGRVRRIYRAGGSAQSPALDLLETAHIPVLGMWGLPESGISHVERLQSRASGSVGRPVQGYVCKLKSARTGERGEILVRSDVLFDGYWDKSGPRTIEDGYLHTGIEGHIESGFLFV